MEEFMERMQAVTKAANDLSEMIQLRLAEQKTDGDAILALGFEYGRAIDLCQDAHLDDGKIDVLVRHAWRVVCGGIIGDGHNPSDYETRIYVVMRKAAP